MVEYSLKNTVLRLNRAVDSYDIQLFVVDKIWFTFITISCTLYMVLVVVYSLSFFSLFFAPFPLLNSVFVTHSNVWQCVEPYVPLCAINSCFEPNENSLFQQFQEWMKEPLITTYIHTLYIQSKSWACILHVYCVLCHIFHSTAFDSIPFRCLWFFFSFLIMPCHVHVI